MKKFKCPQALILLRLDLEGRVHTAHGKHASFVNHTQGGLPAPLVGLTSLDDLSHHLLDVSVLYNISLLTVVDCPVVQSHGLVVQRALHVWGTGLHHEMA